MLPMMIGYACLFGVVYSAIIWIIRPRMRKTMLLYGIMFGGCALIVFGEHALVAMGLMQAPQLPQPK